MDFVKQEYWDNSYNNLNLEFNISSDPVVGLLYQYLNKTTTKTVFEIGCFPGRYLQVFGELGYEIYGVDTTPKTITELPFFLESKGYKIGHLSCKSIFDYQSVKKYDVVCSFGFIEHFDNWQQVIDLHLHHLKPGGILIITVPNFSGFFQHLFHYLFDLENLRRHNLRAMNVKKWKEYLKSKEGNFKVLFSGSFGEIEFWADNEITGRWRSRFKRKWDSIVRMIKKKGIKNSQLYSPYKGIILKYG